MKSSTITYMIRHRFNELWEQKEKREKRKIPLLQISKQTGIPYQTLHAWAHNPEAGRTISTNMIEALCSYFSCKVGDLLELSD